MNTFDLFIFIPIALGLIFGLFRGFVKEVVSLVAVVLAIVAAEMFSPAFTGIIPVYSVFPKKQPKRLPMFLFLSLLSL